MKGTTNIPTFGRRCIAVLLLMACTLVSLYAADSSTKPRRKRIPTRIKTWQLHNDYSQPDTLPIDTSYLNLPMQRMPDAYSIANAYNGNIVSPVQSKIYFDRQEKVRFLFASAYQPYLLTARDVKFYNTTIPYSKVSYRRGFTTYREEHDIDFLFTGNINRRLNLGIAANFLNGVGLYEQTAGKRFAGHVFGSYNGNHYSVQAALIFNTLTNQENGGVDSTLALGGALKSYDMSYYMAGQSAVKHISGFLNHYYSICVEQERKQPLEEPRGGWQEGDKRDTTVVVYLPVMTFKHTFECQQTTKQYLEKSSQASFFDNTYFGSSSTRDTSNVLNIRNTLAVTFEEDFNKWLHFGATVFATNEFQRYAFTVSDQKSPIDPLQPVAPIGQTQIWSHRDTTLAHHWTNNTWVGGELYKNHGKWIRYGFAGNVCLAGYKLGEFSVDGHLRSDIPISSDTLVIAANAYLKNEQPDYFLQHFRSNHFVWENNFGKTYRFYVGGHVSYPTKYVKPKLAVKFENLTRYIYFAENGLPVQSDVNIQVLAANAQVNIRTKRFGMENEVVYQLSSSRLLPLPTLALYHNIYYHDTWFKALMVQIGADMRYHTLYYAPLLNPATGQFCLQQQKLIGNYPIINVYANFFVKALHLKFFVQMQHVNYYFMPKKEYYSMPTYPLNPAVFRAGLAWHFYN